LERRTFAPPQAISIELVAANLFAFNIENPWVGWFWDHRFIWVDMAHPQRFRLRTVIRYSVSKERPYLPESSRNGLQGDRSE
jgi:hypothetical protein